MAEKSRSRAASTAAASTRAPQASGVGVGAMADRRKRVALRRLTDEMLAEIRAAAGLDAYLDELESRLERAVEAYPGIVAAVGKESLAAGGKRLRPLLVCLAAGVPPPESEDLVRACVAVEV